MAMATLARRRTPVGLSGKQRRRFLMACCGPAATLCCWRRHLARVPATCGRRPTSIRRSPKLRRPAALAGARSRAAVVLLTSSGNLDVAQCRAESGRTT